MTNLTSRFFHKIYSQKNKVINMFEYFYGAQAEQFAFFRIPKVLFKDSTYKSLSSDAKILYGMLLDRMNLSAVNGWFDQMKRVYIIYTIEELMEDMGCANQKATKLMNELEKIGLIERKRQGLGKPNLIYVKNFINYQGITFYFSPYEIASYATGIIRATIWFDENPELFYAEYLERPESGFAMSVPLGYEIDVDLDPSDAGKDRLLISAYEDQEYGTYYLNVSKNDTVYEFSDYGYRFVPYLVCVGEAGKEQYYLYVESTQENDYNILYVYDLNQEKMQRTVFEGVGFSGVFYEDAGEYGTYYEYVWNDPQNFEMTTKIEILGTWSGRRLYTVNVENGLPEAHTEDYEIFSYLGTVSRIPLEVTMLSDMQTKELPAGTTFYFVRTDGESYVDAVLDDGRECRIYVEFEDWNQYINGVNQWECFEELMYAG